MLQEESLRISCVYTDITQIYIMVQINLSDRKRFQSTNTTKLKSSDALLLMC